MCYLQMNSLFSGTVAREITDAIVPFVDPLTVVSECSTSSVK